MGQQSMLKLSGGRVRGGLLKIGGKKYQYKGGDEFNNSLNERKSVIIYRNEEYTFK